MMCHLSSSRFRKRTFQSRTGSSLIEIMAGFFVFIPLCMLGADVAVLFLAAHANEEFAEQLARVCATLPDKANAIKASQDVIKQYHLPPNVRDLRLSNLEFDLGNQEITITTSMDVKLPVPAPGYAISTVTANVKQPILSIPSPP